MATAAAAPTYARPTSDAGTGLRSWLATTDHKRIGILYLYTSLFFFLWGGLEAGVIRAQLSGPNAGLITAEDRKSTRLNSSHANISYAVFCLKKTPSVPHTSITLRSLEC